MIEFRLNRNKAAVPLYLQIAGQIEWHILNGLTEHAALLPCTRDLSRQLSVSRGCVIRAYEVLCLKGLCESHVGRGTAICASREGNIASAQRKSERKAEVECIPDSALPGSISLLPSHACTTHLPVTEFRQAFNRVLRYPGRLNQFGLGNGNTELRSLICSRILPSRGISASPAEVLVVPGTQYGSMLLAMTLNKERSVFHFGSPGYLEFAQIFSRFGFQLKHHAIDEQGVNLSAFSGSDNDIFYLMPEHHFPCGMTLSEHRRIELVEKAVRKNVLLLEDDYDSEFYFDRAPEPALRASKASGQVIYMGTFSKILFNSLRLGYMVANKDLIDEMASLHWQLSRGTSELTQQWVSELLKSGTYERHVKRMRTIYRDKRDSVIKLIKKYLPSAHFNVPSGGLQLCIEFPEPGTTEIITDWMEKNRIQVKSSRHFVAGNHAPRFLVLGFANSTVSETEQVLQELNRYLQRGRT